MNTRFDTLYLLGIGLLVAIGLLMILSTSSVVGMANYKDSYFFIKRHISYVLLGSIGLFIGYRIPFKQLEKHAFWGYFIALGLLICTFVPGIGVQINGAARWINTGIINLQPVELMKFFIIIVIAQTLARKHHQNEQFKHGMLPILTLISAPVVLLLLQPDLGNTLLIIMVTMILLFLSNIPIRHLLSLIGVGCIGLIAYIASNPYQIQRIQTFLFPSKDPLGQSYHIIQSLTAIGSGGITGLGLGQSKLKYFYIPFHYSDFIYSIICEEGGLILGVSVILLFMLIFMRGMIIAKRQTERSRFLIVMGLNLFLVIQALINMGVVIGVLPVTGIPLTFISFGGTSMIMSLFFVGVILNVSKET